MPERLAPNDWLKKWMHAEIDAGADIVVMHGAPLLHGVEIYHGRPIFYDLGNFIYNVPPTLTYIDEPINWESAVAHVQFQGKKLAIDHFPPRRTEQYRRGPARRAQRVHQQPVPGNARAADAGDGRESRLHLAAPGRRVQAVRHRRRGEGRYRERKVACPALSRRHRGRILNPSAFGSGVAQAYNLSC